MLIPSYGFEGKKSNKGIGLRKPRSRGFSRVYFSQHWPNETSESVSYFAGGAVSLRYAGNGQLCVLNAPNRKFHVCDRCGAAAVGGEELQHWEWCKRIQNEPFIAHHDALGASFVSDVLELTIEINSKPNVMEEDWNSVLWTLFTAASNLLEIPETELGGTMYENTQGSWSVMIYDDVPGGAGHSRWLFENASLLFEEAYRTVDGHCGCGEETCCYGCIANYYNQQEQSNLSRGAAKRILGELLGR